MDNKDIFSIRQLIDLTGLSEFTIRGWENRYSAFNPNRSDTGRREYSKIDVERALLIRELLKRGHKISKVANLTHQKLTRLFEQANDTYQSENKNQWSKVVTDARELLALQKWNELSQLFKKISYRNIGDYIHSFFLPLLIDLSDQINSGIVSIAQEHIFSAFLKEKIYSLLIDLEIKKTTRKKKLDKVRFVLATPEGDYHEIGLLLAHLLIRSHGFTSLFLGPHTPAQDLAETALRFDASHLLIVSTISKKQGARQDLLTFTSDVQKKIETNVPILIAGPQSPLLQNDQGSTLKSLSSFPELDKYLLTLKMRK